MSEAKLLVLDIETAPCLGYFFNLRDQNIGIEQVFRDSFVFMWGAKWYGSDKIMTDRICDHKLYKKNPYSSEEIAKSIIPIIEKADLVITQNGNSFDLPWLSQLWLIHNIAEPNNWHQITSSNGSIDLYRRSKRWFYSASHKLDYRCKQLLIGSKLAHQGFKLWADCYSGDKKAFDTMEKYMKHDVFLTEKYYEKLRPRLRNHPNVNMFSEQPYGGRLKCPACGSPDLIKRGFNYGPNGKKQTFSCNECGYRPTLKGAADPTTKTLMN